MFTHFGIDIGISTEYQKTSSEKNYLNASLNETLSISNASSFPVWKLDLFRRLTLFGTTLYGWKVEFLFVFDPDRMVHLDLSQNLPHTLFILILILKGEGGEVALAVIDSLVEAAGCIHKLEHSLWGLNRMVAEGHRIYHRRRLDWTLFSRD